MTSNAIANVDMAAAWDGAEGDDWARDWQHYDDGVREYHLRLLEAADLTAGERVLDVGCGTGQLTRDAGRATVDGPALGVDLSARMLERARGLARADALDNVAFEQADAQVHPFAPAGYDVVVSRFGTMFFADPVAAFVNVGRAMRPGARLVMVVWKDLSHNEWLQALIGALAVGRTLPGPPVGAPGPLGQADPDGVRATLTAAGFDRVEIQSAAEPFLAGTDAEDAFTFLGSTGAARGMLDGLSVDDRARALAALRSTMEQHDSGDGVWFRSGCWIIRAQRPH